LCGLGEVHLAFVEFERLAQGGGGFVGSAGSVEDFSEVAEGVALPVERVGAGEPHTRESAVCRVVVPKRVAD
jgi:hypothetical protein